MSLVPEHAKEVWVLALGLITKTQAAAKTRLMQEINFRGHQGETLTDHEQAGKASARLHSEEACKRSDTLHARLGRRMVELELEKQITLLLPAVVGGMLVVPPGILAEMRGMEDGAQVVGAVTLALAAWARVIIMDVERGLGFEPADWELEKHGYDIESRVPATGVPWSLEVKGWVTGAASITVTRNEILYSLNKPEDFISVIGEFLPEARHGVPYIRPLIKLEPDFSMRTRIARLQN